MQKNALHIKKVPYKGFYAVTVVISVIVLIIYSCIASQYIIYDRGLSSFNEVIFADGAVSDNNQLL